MSSQVQNLDTMWYLTDHAIDQFQNRFATKSSPQEAIAALADVSRSALKVDNQTEDGKLWYVSTAWPGVRFVVADDRPGSLPTLVTVVPHAGLPLQIAEYRNNGATWRRKNVNSRKKSRRRSEDE